MSQWPPANIYEYSFDAKCRNPEGNEIKDFTLMANTDMSRALLIAEYFISV